MKKLFIIPIVVLTFFTACDEEKAEIKTKPIKKTFILKTFDDNKSHTILRNDTKFTTSNNKTTIVNFFATWCEPCHIEAEHLNELYDKYAEDINIISISLEQKISKYNLNQFKIKNNIKYDIINNEDGFALSKAIGSVRSFPTMFLINKDGKLIEKYVGIVPIEMLDYDIKKTIGQH